jgi:4-hydroxythreonine-4-phosphate dehydrogenase
MTENQDKDRKVVVGVTHGDINGISYEIIIKTFQDPRMLELFTPVVYGTAKVASYHRKSLNINDFSFNIIRKADQMNHKKANLVNLHDQEVKIDLGQSTEVAGELALLSLEAAVEDLRNGVIDVLVTAPINKRNIQQPGFKFPGHTEYLASKFSSDDYLMLMVGPQMRVGVVTGHIPLKDVAGSITEELVFSKIQTMHNTLVKDFGIRRPRIAVLGLNPHAGDKGLLGKEEDEIITPAINHAINNSILAFGPFPADGFFGFSEFMKYDAILAMYHDQGLIPFKTLSYDEGVNFTAGLPFIRTSPAHGTAYTMAGKDLANPDSFRAACFLAVDIFRTRKMNNELTESALQTSRQAEKDN